MLFCNFLCLFYLMVLTKCHTISKSIASYDQLDDAIDSVHDYGWATFYNGRHDRLHPKYRRHETKPGTKMAKTTELTTKAMDNLTTSENTILTDKKKTTDVKCNLTESNSTTHPPKPPCSQKDPVKKTTMNLIKLFKSRLTTILKATTSTSSTKRRKRFKFKKHKAAALFTKSTVVTTSVRGVTDRGKRYVIPKSKITTKVGHFRTKPEGYTKLFDGNSNGTGNDDRTADDTSYEDYKDSAEFGKDNQAREKPKPSSEKYYRKEQDELETGDSDYGFGDTANIEKILNKIKVHAINVISAQSPALTEIITNAVTETTFDIDPSLHPSSSKSENKDYDSAFQSGEAELVDDIKGENAPHIETNSNNMRTIANYELKLQQEMQNVYSKAKGKLAEGYQKARNQVNRVTWKVLHSTAKGIDQLSDKLTSSKMPSIETQHSDSLINEHKSDLKNLPTNILGKKSSLKMSVTTCETPTKPLTTKRLSASKTSVTLTTTETSEPTRTSKLKKFSSQTDHQHKVNTKSTIEEKTIEAHDKAIHNTPTDSVFQQEQDDYTMLKQYENVLSKNHDDNVMNMLTTALPSLPKGMSLIDKFKVSKRDTETVEDLKLRDNIRLQNDGEGMPEPDSLDFLSNTKYKKDQESGVEVYNEGNAAAMADSTIRQLTSPDNSLIGLTNKIHYNEYINGYKHYLNFARDLSKFDGNYSAQVRYQAHRHHNVDDIGKFILTRLPSMPEYKNSAPAFNNKRSKRIIHDDSDLEDQDVSTKSEESWFKKHFYVFRDPGPVKKFHTEQTVTLKSGKKEVPKKKNQRREIPIKVGKSAEQEEKVSGLAEKEGIVFRWISRHHSKSCKTTKPCKNKVTKVKPAKKTKKTKKPKCSKHAAWQLYLQDLSSTTHSMQSEMDLDGMLKNLNNSCQNINSASRLSLANLPPAPADKTTPWMTDSSTFPSNLNGFVSLHVIRNTSPSRPWRSHNYALVENSRSVFNQILKKPGRFSRFNKYITHDASNLDTKQNIEVSKNNVNAAAFADKGEESHNDNADKKEDKLDTFVYIGHNGIPYAVANMGKVGKYGNHAVDKSSLFDIGEELRRFERKAKDPEKYTSTAHSESKEKPGYVDLHIVPKSSTETQLEKTTVKKKKKNKFKHFLNQIMHKKKQKQKDMERKGRIRRHNPIELIKKLFKPSTTSSYTDNGYNMLTTTEQTNKNNVKDTDIDQNLNDFMKTEPVIPYTSLDKSMEFNGTIIPLFYIYNSERSFDPTKKNKLSFSNSDDPFDIRVNSQTPKFVPESLHMTVTPTTIDEVLKDLHADMYDKYKTNYISAVAYDSHDNPLSRSTKNAFSGLNLPKMSFKPFFDTFSVSDQKKDTMRYLTRPYKNYIPEKDYIFSEDTGFINNDVVHHRMNNARDKWSTSEVFKYTRSDLRKGMTSQDVPDSAKQGDKSKGTNAKVQSLRTQTKFNTPPKYHETTGFYYSHPDYFTDFMNWNRDILYGQKISKPELDHIVNNVLNLTATKNIQSLRDEVLQMKSYINDLSSHEEIKTSINTKKTTSNNRAPKMIRNSKLRDENSEVVPEIVNNINKLYQQSLRKYDIANQKLTSAMPSSLDITSLAYDGNVELYSDVLDNIDIFAKTPRRKTETKNYPSAKTRISPSPEQYFRTPLPMQPKDFNQFLKDNDLDVKKITSPLSEIFKFEDTWAKQGHIKSTLMDLKRKHEKIFNFSDELKNMEPSSKPYRYGSLENDPYYNKKSMAGDATGDNDSLESEIETSEITTSISKPPKDEPDHTEFVPQEMDQLKKKLDYDIDKSMRGEQIEKPLAIESDKLTHLKLNRRPWLNKSDKINVRPDKGSPDENSILVEHEELETDTMDDTAIVTEYMKSKDYHNTLKQKKITPFESMPDNLKTTVKFKFPTRTKKYSRENENYVYLSELDYGVFGLSEDNAVNLPKDSYENPHNKDGSLKPKRKTRIFKTKGNRNANVTNKVFRKNNITEALNNDLDITIIDIEEVPFPKTEEEKTYDPPFAVVHSNLFDNPETTEFLPKFNPLDIDPVPDEVDKGVAEMYHYNRQTNTPLVSKKKNYVNLMMGQNGLPSLDNIPPELVIEKPIRKLKEQIKDTKNGKDKLVQPQHSDLHNKLLYEHFDVNQFIKAVTGKLFEGVTEKLLIKNVTTYDDDSNDKNIHSQYDSDTKVKPYGYRISVTPWNSPYSKYIGEDLFPNQTPTERMITMFKNGVESMMPRKFHAPKRVQISSHKLKYDVLYDEAVRNKKSHTAGRPDFLQNEEFKYENNSEASPNVDLRKDIFLLEASTKEVDGWKMEQNRGRFDLDENSGRLRRKAMWRKWKSATTLTTTPGSTSTKNDTAIGTKKAFRFLPIFQRWQKKCKNQNVSSSSATTTGTTLSTVLTTHSANNSNQSEETRKRGLRTSNPLSDFIVSALDDYELNKLPKPSDITIIWPAKVIQQDGKHVLEENDKIYVESSPWDIHLSSSRTQAATKTDETTDNPTEYLLPENVLNEANQNTESPNLSVQPSDVNDDKLNMDTSSLVYEYPSFYFKHNPLTMVTANAPLDLATVLDVKKAGEPNQPTNGLTLPGFLLFQKTPRTPEGSVTEEYRNEFYRGFDSGLNNILKNYNDDSNANFEKKINKTEKFKEEIAELANSEKKIRKLLAQMQKAGTSFLKTTTEPAEKYEVTTDSMSNWHLKNILNTDLYTHKDQAEFIHQYTENSPTIDAYTYHNGQAKIYAKSEPYQKESHAIIDTYIYGSTKKEKNEDWKNIIPDYIQSYEHEIAEQPTNDGKEVSTQTIKDYDYVIIETDKNNGEKSPQSSQGENSEPLPSDTYPTEIEGEANVNKKLQPAGEDADFPKTEDSLKNENENQNKLVDNVSKATEKALKDAETAEMSVAKLSSHATKNLITSKKSDHKKTTENSIQITTNKAQNRTKTILAKTKNKNCKTIESKIKTTLSSLNETKPTKDTKKATITADSAHSKATISLKPKVYKRESTDASNTYTAKDVAALEVIVDLLDETGCTTDCNARGQKFTKLNPYRSTNAIQVHIAVPFCADEKKREIKPENMRQIFSAKMSAPVDIEYQVRSLEFVNKISTPVIDSISPGMYLLVEDTKASNGFALKPLIRQVKMETTSPSTAQTKSAKTLTRVTLSKEYIQLINEQLLKLHQNLSAVESDKKTRIKKKCDGINFFQARERRRINWEKVRKYFVGKRVCQCKCRANHTMCRACVASDAVMAELLFEFENLDKYMSDHCTEIQTFFWMNPSGGKKLRDAVHKIDKNINDYYKRVRGKCQGRTCNMFQPRIDKRELIEPKPPVDGIYIGEPLIEDVRDLETSFEQVKELKLECECDEAFKRIADKLVHTTDTCTKSPAPKKRSALDKKKTLSLDNINVNIICSPKAALEQVENTINELDTTFPIIDYTDDEVKNTSKKGLKGIFRKSKNSVKNKRETKKDSSLNVEDYTTLWQEDIKLNAANSKIEPVVTLDVLAKDNDETFTLNPNLKATLVRVTPGNFDLKSSRKFGKNLEITTVKDAELITMDLVTRPESLSSNLGELIKLFGSLPSEAEVKKLEIETHGSQMSFKRENKLMTSSTAFIRNVPTTTTKNVTESVTKLSTTKDLTTGNSSAFKAISLSTNTDLPIAAVSTFPSTMENTTYSDHSYSLPSTKKSWYDKLKSIITPTPKVDNDFLIKKSKTAKSALKIDMDANFHVNSDETTSSFPTLFIFEDLENTSKENSSTNEYGNLLVTILEYEKNRIDEELAKERKRKSKSFSLEKDLNDILLLGRAADMRVATTTPRSINTSKKEEDLANGDYSMLNCFRKEESAPASTPKQGLLAKLFKSLNSQKAENRLVKDVTKVQYPQAKWSEEASKQSRLKTPEQRKMDNVNWFIAQCASTIIISNDDLININNTATSEFPFISIGATALPFYQFSSTKKVTKNQTVGTTAASYNHDKKVTMDIYEDLTNWINRKEIEIETSRAKEKQNKTKTIAQNNNINNLNRNNLNNNGNRLNNNGNNVNNNKATTTAKSEITKKIEKIVMKLPKKDFKDKSKDKEACDPKTEVCMCDIRATSDHIVDVRKTTPRREFEVFVRNVTCHKYKKPPPYFVLDDRWKKKIRRRNTQKNKRLNTYYESAPLKKSLRWDWIRRRRSISDDDDSENDVTDEGNEELVDWAYKKRSLLSIGDDGDENNEESDHLLIDDTFYEAKKLDVIKTFKYRHKIYNDFEVGHFEKMYKDKDNVFRFRSKRLKRTAGDIHQLEKGLKNLPPLEPSDNEVYAMQGDRISIDCTDHSRSYKYKPDPASPVFWETDRPNMLRLPNVTVNGPAVVLQKVQAKSSGNYTCTQDGRVRTVKLTVVTVPDFHVVSIPMYFSTDGCNYDDLRAFQRLGRVISRDICACTKKRDSVHIDEAICLEDKDDGTVHLRATAIMTACPHPAVDCSPQCRRDIQCGLALLCATNAPVLHNVKVVIAKQGHNKTMTPSFRNNRKLIVTHTLRKKDLQKHAEYHQLAASMYPGNLDIVVSCPAGFYLMPKHKICAVCPADTYSLAGENTCYSCGAGMSSEPGSARCRVSLRRMRRYDWWWYPPCGYAVAGGGVLCACLVCTACALLAHVTSRSAARARPGAGAGGTGGEGEAGAVSRADSRWTWSRRVAAKRCSSTSAGVPTHGGPPSPSAVILARFFRVSASSSRATADSQETKFEQWKEKNIPPPLPPIDFDLN